MKVACASSQGRRRADCRFIRVLAGHPVDHTAGDRGGMVGEAFVVEADWDRIRPRGRRAGAGGEVR